METLEKTIITIYGNKDYYTMLEDGQLYLMSGDGKLISIINKDNTMKIRRRDLANCFLDLISHSDIDLESLPEHKIVHKLFDVLRKDIQKAYDSHSKSVESTNLFEGRFKTVFDAFNDKNKSIIINAMIQMKVIDNHSNPIVPFKVIEDDTEARKSMKNLKPFIKLCASNQHYDICERTPNKGYIIIAKNGGCGTLKSLVEDKDNKVIVVFDKQSIIKPDHTSKNITKLIEVDLQGTPYKAANRFVKLEESLTKEYNILAEKICEKQGFCDLNKFNYPNLDNETGDIAKLIRHAQKQGTPQETINAIKISLEGLYNSAYKKLEASAKTLNDLIKQYGI